MLWYAIPMIGAWPLRFTSFLTCKKFEQNPDGTVNIYSAGFDHVDADKFPMKLKEISVLVFLTFEETEESAKLFVKLVDPDGEPIADFLKKDIRRESANMRSVMQPVSFYEISFPEPGCYSFEVFLDGGHKASLPLYL